MQYGWSSIQVSRYQWQYLCVKYSSVRIINTWVIYHSLALVLLLGESLFGRLRCCRRGSEVIYVPLYLLYLCLPTSATIHCVRYVHPFSKVHFVKETRMPKKGLNTMRSPKSLTIFTCHNELTFAMLENSFPEGLQYWVQYCMEINYHSAQRKICLFLGFWI